MLPISQRTRSKQVNVEKKVKAIEDRVSQINSKAQISRVFADENSYIHPNKRINLATSGEFQLSKSNIVKNSIIIETKKMSISEKESQMNGLVIVFKPYCNHSDRFLRDSLHFVIIIIIWYYS
jgi:hypothetical protein